jgi:hypothetical protein
VFRFFVVLFLQQLLLFVFNPTLQSLRYYHCIACFLAYKPSLPLAKLPTTNDAGNFGHAVIATDANQREREAVRWVARQRKQITSPGGVYNYNQKIIYVAWEHEIFWKQLQGGIMDHLCGPGFESLYFYSQHHPESVGADQQQPQSLSDDLLLTCLLNMGAADGYVKSTVTLHGGSITRGLQGVAAKYVHENRIHSDLIVLPILSLKDRKSGRSGSHGSIENNTKRPSTQLPSDAVRFLLSLPSSSTGSELLRDGRYVAAYEEYLYTVLRNDHDPDRWVLWNAACEESDRDALQDKEKLMATSCDHHGRCCWFFDPDQKPRSYYHNQIRQRSEHDD